MEYDDMKNTLDQMLMALNTQNVNKAKNLLDDDIIQQIGESILDGNLDELNTIVFSGYINTIEDICKYLGLCDHGSFLVQHYNYIENSFSQMYIRYEGFACSSDKSRTVAKRLFNFYKANVMISFNPEADYTYHHPKKILNDHESIVQFFTALKSLYYGSPQQYLNCIIDINRRSKS